MALLSSDKWLYVHVPKTGGTSLSHILQKYKCDFLSTHGRLNSQRNLGNKFVFGFVRNPFTRFASLFYSHIREHGKIPIEQFIENHQEWDYFFDTQTDWLEYNGKLDRIDYVGKYENLDSSLKYIFDKIDIEPTTLPYLNQNTIKDTFPNMDMYDYYKKRCYTNPKVVQFVRNKYRKDFQNFDYGMAL